VAKTLTSSKEVAERAGVDVSTVAKWVRAGKLTPVYEGDGLTGVRLFDPADVDAFIAGRTTIRVVTGPADEDYLRVDL